MRVADAADRLWHAFDILNHAAELGVPFTPARANERHPVLGAEDDMIVQREVG